MPHILRVLHSLSPLSLSAASSCVGHAVMGGGQVISKSGQITMRGQEPEGGKGGKGKGGKGESREWVTVAFYKSSLYCVCCLHGVSIVRSLSHHQ